MKRATLTLIAGLLLVTLGCREEFDRARETPVPPIDLPSGPHANVAFQASFSDTIVLQVMKDGTIYVSGQRGLLREVTSLITAVYPPGQYTVVIRAQPETPFTILQQVLQAIETSDITARKVLLAASGLGGQERAFAYGLWFGANQPLKRWHDLLAGLDDEADGSTAGMAAVSPAGYSRLTVDVDRRGYAVDGQMYDRSGFFNILRSREAEFAALLVVFRIPPGLPYQRLIDCCDHSLQFGVTSYAFQAAPTAAAAR